MTELHQTFEADTPLRAPRFQRWSTIEDRRQIWMAAGAVIAERYAEPLEVNDVARAVYTSRRQLQRVFLDQGTTFREHVCRVRMEVAASMLAAGGTTVKAVAQAVGYSQPAQFAKAFRRCHGVTPSAFRRAAPARTA